MAKNRFGSGYQHGSEITDNSLRKAYMMAHEFAHAEYAQTPGAEGVLKEFHKNGEFLEDKFEKLGVQPALRDPEIKKLNQQQIDTGNRLEHQAHERAWEVVTIMNRLLQVLCALFTLCAATVGQTATDASAVPCEKLPTIRELTSKEAKRVLAAFGYNLRQPYDCTKLTSRWYGTSMVLLFRSVPTRLDDQTNFSVVFTSSPHEIWVLAIASGMVEYPRVESDPHNLAAFNALLAGQTVPTTDPEWISLARSYLAIIGHEKAMLSPQISCAGGECTVELSEQQSPQVLIQWALSFDKTGRTARLQDVSRELGKRE